MADLPLFVEPDIGKVVDLQRGFEFLDKELAEIHPDPEASNIKVVDKLVKVFLRDGAERWVLLHVEIQGKNGKEFPARMFEYFMRLRKRGHPVAAIAVLTGKKGSIAPESYEDRCLWTTVRYEYKTLRILDYADDVLAASDNPFAAVMLVAKEVFLLAEGTDEERDQLLLEQKLLMVKLLNEKTAIFGERKARAIKYFLYNYLVFKNPETNRKFIEESAKLSNKKNTTMGIFEQMEEILRQEGMEEGLEKAAKSLLTNSNFSVEKIAELLEVPLALVEKVKKELKTK